MKAPAGLPLNIDAEDLLHIVRSLAVGGAAPFAKVHQRFVGGRVGLAERLALALAELERLDFIERIPDGRIDAVMLSLTERGRQAYPS